MLSMWGASETYPSTIGTVPVLMSLALLDVVPASALLGK